MSLGGEARNEARINIRTTNSHGKYAETHAQLQLAMGQHGSGTGLAERHHVRPAEAAFRAHLKKPQGTFGKSVVNV